MENEERSIALPKQAQELLDHESLDELKCWPPVLQWKYARHGTDQNLNWFWASAKLSQILYSFDNALVVKEVFPKENSMPTQQQVIYENK
jgi:hypothetical protein